MREAHFARWMWQRRPMIACLTPGDSHGFAYSVGVDMPTRDRFRHQGPSMPPGTCLRLYDPRYEPRIMGRAIDAFPWRACRVCWDGAPCDVWKATELAVQRDVSGVVVGEPSRFGDQFPFYRVETYWKGTFPHGLPTEAPRPDHEFRSLVEQALGLVRAVDAQPVAPPAASTGRYLSPTAAHVSQWRTPDGRGALAVLAPFHAVFNERIRALPASKTQYLRGPNVWLVRWLAIEDTLSLLTESFRDCLCPLCFELQPCPAWNLLGLLKPDDHRHGVPGGPMPERWRLRISSMLPPQTFTVETPGPPQPKPTRRAGPPQARP